MTVWNCDVNTIFSITVPSAAPVDARPGSGRRRERTIEGEERVARRFESTVAIRAGGRRGFGPETATVRLLGNREDPPVDDLPNPQQQMQLVRLSPVAAF